MAPKMPPTSKDIASASATEMRNAEGQTDDDDDAPTPKHWSSDWDPTLNSLLSACVLHSLSVSYYVSCTVVNPLESRGNHSATSNNMKLVHWPLMGGLFH